ncbi:MAG: monovalent cation/H+ antiporter subunit A [Proteobacteria bacterium]|nr:monovalent cation/H+ antiporter subunit A [Pseudomonadota bacterium]MBU1388610.1 monovalent cation/H+ antiporter subunit A [Pseudomonadota bacterium]MBU1541766.1 monovalent cation/H+ antiporter subunit A [Pseudomonadota bacterium]MBU2430422.1 monovalent cation/H+ antiporter subunit A [Pseudomonadota bacterium]MBU2482334.1 monovalent cation/H+ antiporter subunit A [Pseudomonadota bacterium]
MIIALIPLLPLAGSIIPFLFSSRSHHAAAAGCVAGVSLILLLAQAPAVFAGQMPIHSWQWIPAIGLNFAFRISGFGFLVACLILGIGLLIILYARYYLSTEDPMGRFYAYLLLFMGSMLGIVLSENLILLMMFWELTSISSFLLIGFWTHRADARQGARMALIITGGGGFAMLAGFILLGHIVGSFELTDILASKEQVQGHHLYAVTLVLILLGAFTKSAQFPFQFWLPHAMAAPTPVSAYLHSATMVKAGVFMLALMFPVLSGSALWFYLVAPVGLVTLVFAAYMAMFKDDLKGLLAYSTVSHLGLITLLLGLGSPLAAVAAVFHLFNHAMFKAGLFMLSGIIDHEAGTRDMNRLSGLWKYMPVTATLTMAGCAAMAGIPMFNGFLSKEMFLAQTLKPNLFGDQAWIIPLGATLASIFAVAYSIRMIHEVFFNGPATDMDKQPHEPSRGMRLPAEILMALCLLVGIFPAVLAGPMVNAAAQSILGPEMPEFTLSLWHGFNLALAMSAIAIIGGIVVFKFRRYLFDSHIWFSRYCDGKAIFETVTDWLIQSGYRLNQAVFNSSLQRYMALLIISVIVLGSSPFWRSETKFLGTATMTAIDPVTFIMGIILILCALATVITHRNRILSIIMLGTVGLIVSLTFSRFSAPDLALTQISVETVTIILLMMALFMLPRNSPKDSSRYRRQRDVLLAGLAGGGAGALAMGILTRPYETISDFFLAQSVPGGGGTNVVNVILVDFRGFDTLGEITVLAIAGLAIYALLHNFEIEAPQTDALGRPWTSDRFPMILANITRPLLPLALLFSAYIFLRGHNEPGGGFIAGLITAAALILQYIASGIVWTRPRLNFDNHIVMAWGLIVALVTGLCSWVFHYPFLTSTFTYVSWPWIGKFELASAIVFDLGVFLVVVGSVMLILVKLGAVNSPDAQTVSTLAQHHPDLEPEKEMF